MTMMNTEERPELMEHQLAEILHLLKRKPDKVNQTQHLEELSQAGLFFGRQQRVPIRYKKVILATPLKLDLIVEGKIIVDNKAKQTVTPIDKQALLTYLRLRKVYLGLIINFHELKLVDGVQRIVNNLAE